MIFVPLNQAVKTLVSKADKLVEDALIHQLRKTHNLTSEEAKELIDFEVEERMRRGDNEWRNLLQSYSSPPRK